jgi:hypothetical protein
VSNARYRAGAAAGVRGTGIALTDIFNMKVEHILDVVGPFLDRGRAGGAAVLYDEDSGLDWLEVRH